MKQDAAIKEFAKDAGILFYGLATVPDDWINQLKTYHKITIEDEETGMMWLATLSMYIELLIARIDDLVNVKEQATIENECLEESANCIGLVNFSGQQDEQEKTSDVENTLRNLITIHREIEVKYDLTVPQSYTTTLIRRLGNKLPEQVITSYIEMKIGLFEEAKLRERLQKVI